MSSLSKTAKDITLSLVGSVLLVMALTYVASRGLKHLHQSVQQVPSLTPGDLAWGLTVVVSLRWAWLFILWLERQAAE